MKQPEVTVCIPWRPSPSRMKAYDRVRGYWAKYFPRWPVITADSDGEIFSLARARNAAVAQATTDVVVIADADTLPLLKNVRAAVADPVGICWPFTQYRVLAMDYVDAPLAKLATVKPLNSWDGEGVLGVGGVIVCTTKEYWRLGGQPPEFVGWGWEDTTWSYVVRTLSTAKRIEGPVFAFEHNRDSVDGYMQAVADSPGWNRDIHRNKELAVPYRNADGRPWLMREILRRRDEGKMWPYVGFG